MRRFKIKSKQIKKFRFLFDSAFAKPLLFRKLSKKAKLAHVRHTYNLAPTTEDQQIYNLATKENWIIITQDIGFRNQIKKGCAGVIIIPSYLSNEQIDNLLTKFISMKNPEDYIGKATKV